MSGSGDFLVLSNDLEWFDDSVFRSDDDEDDLTAIVNAGWRFRPDADWFASDRITSTYRRYKIS
jgi:hypothetical protein